ncbi:MAG: hypothetical protein IPP73_15210 [Chitinophagaceae bacterium]|nr:hypothetical protein [Chitinophagaceae bacterium]
MKELLKDSVLNQVAACPANKWEKTGVSNEEIFKQTGAKQAPAGTWMKSGELLRENIATDNKSQSNYQTEFRAEMDLSTENKFQPFFIVIRVPGATPKELTHGFYRFSNASFSTDGKQIVLSA